MLFYLWVLGEVKVSSGVTKKTSLFAEEMNLESKNHVDTDLPQLNRNDTVKITETSDERYKRKPQIPCQYGLKCYRKNPSHFEEFSHPRKFSSFFY